MILEQIVILKKRKKIMSWCYLFTLTHLIQILKYDNNTFHFSKEFVENLV